MVPAHPNPIRSSNHRWTHLHNLWALAPPAMPSGTARSLDWRILIHHAMATRPTVVDDRWTMTATVIDAPAIVFAVHHDGPQLAWYSPRATHNAWFSRLMATPHHSMDSRVSHCHCYCCAHWRQCGSRRTLCSVCTVDLSSIVFVVAMVSHSPSHCPLQCWTCSNRVNRIWRQSVLRRCLHYCYCCSRWLHRRQSADTRAVAPWRSFYQSLWKF